MPPRFEDIVALALYILVLVGILAVIMLKLRKSKMQKLLYMQIFNLTSQILSIVPMVMDVALQEPIVGTYLTVYDVFAKASSISVLVVVYFILVQNSQVFSVFVSRTNTEKKVIRTAQILYTLMFGAGLVLMLINYANDKLISRFVM
jgi:hypothetical protein